MDKTTSSVADHLSFTAEIDRWSDMILRLAFCRSNNQSDAEDVFQNVFLKLLKHATPFDSDEHKKAWLLRVTINCCNDVHRSTSLKKEVSLDDVETPAQTNELSIECLDLRTALTTLPAKQRIAIHLYYFEDCTTNEIAVATGDKPATVRSHLHRARTALRITLGGAQ